MFKKLIFLALVLAIVPAFTMEESGKKVANWPDWVQKTDTIQVTSALGKETFDISIQSDSTILDIKNSLYYDIGIPVGQQQLLAAEKGWFDNIKRKSPALDNQTNVKDVMAIYNTALLTVYLTLGKPQQENDN